MFTKLAGRLIGDSEFVEFLFKCVLETSIDFCQRSFSERTSYESESSPEKVFHFSLHSFLIFMQVFELKIKWGESSHPVTVFNKQGAGTLSFIQLNPNSMDPKRKITLLAQRVKV